MSLLAKRTSPPRYPTRRPALAAGQRHQRNADLREKRRMAVVHEEVGTGLPLVWKVVLLFCAVAYLAVLAIVSGGGMT